ncbi:MAG: hypothetical protein Q7W30_01455 [Coriobacteriia bacterium]|nr:hypothetical protein [Coriobacteriia bacterium]
MQPITDVDWADPLWFEDVTQYCREAYQRLGVSREKQDADVLVRSVIVAIRLVERAKVPAKKTYRKC